MKIKELIRLNSTDSLRLYMENQGIKNLTDEELDAAYGVCEGHGYELFTTDLKNGLLYRVDYSLAREEDEELPEEEYDYCRQTPELFLDSMLEYLGELCTDSYELQDDYEGYSKDKWKSYFETYNLLLDFNNKIRESYKKYKYTTEVTVLVHDIPQIKTTKETFDTAFACDCSISKLVNNFISLPRTGELIDLSGKYDLSSQRELNKFLLELKEQSTINLLWDNTYLSIKTTVEAVPEIYYIATDKIKYGVYDHTSELYHFDSKEKAIQKFNELVNPYKEKYPECDLGEHDSVYEASCDEARHYELFIDDYFNFECSLGLADIQ